MINFEYPKPTFVHKSEDFFKSVTMFDLSFPTTIHYFKNHDNDFTEILITTFGFGIRVTW